jgi:hypothetical protein
MNDGGVEWLAGDVLLLLQCSVTLRLLGGPPLFLWRDQPRGAVGLKWRVAMGSYQLVGC